MGHSSITTTQKYLHTLPNADHAAVTALNHRQTHHLRSAIDSYRVNLISPALASVGCTRKPRVPGRFGVGYLHWATAVDGRVADFLRTDQDPQHYVAPPTTQTLIDAPRAHDG